MDAVLAVEDVEGLVDRVVYVPGDVITGRGGAEQKTERVAGVGGGSEQGSSGARNRPPPALTRKPELVIASRSGGDPSQVASYRIGHRRSLRP